MRQITIEKWEVIAWCILLLREVVKTNFQAATSWKRELLIKRQNVNKGGGGTWGSKDCLPSYKTRRIFPTLFTLAKSKKYVSPFLLQKRRFTTNILLQEIQIWRQKVEKWDGWHFGGMESASISSFFLVPIVGCNVEM